MEVLLMRGRQTQLHRQHTSQCQHELQPGDVHNAGLFAAAPPPLAKRIDDSAAAAAAAAECLLCCCLVQVIAAEIVPEKWPAGVDFTNACNAQ